MLKRKLIRRSKKRSLRKNYGRKKLYGGVVRNTASNELKVFVDPFSAATKSPKIPDGSVNYSFGVAVKGKMPITVDSTTNSYVVLHAGRRAHSTLYSNGLSMRLGAGCSLDGVQFNGVEKWRGVSFGMKLNLISDTENAIGTWEAIRFKQTAILNASSLDLPSLANAVDTNGDWPNDPSYSTGTLRELKNKKFILGHVTDEYLWTPNTVADNSEGGDANFDTIVVRIRCTGATLATILSESFGNYEIVYHSTHDLNRMQTLCTKVDPDVLAKARYRIFNRHKAAAS